MSEPGRPQGDSCWQHFWLPLALALALYWAILLAGSHRNLNAVEDILQPVRVCSFLAEVALHRTELFANTIFNMLDVNISLTGRTVVYPTKCLQVKKVWSCAESPNGHISTSLSFVIWSVLKTSRHTCKRKCFLFHFQHCKESHCLYTKHWSKTELSMLWLKWFQKINSLLLKKINKTHESK